MWKTSENQHPEALFILAVAIKRSKVNFMKVQPGRSIRKFVSTALGSVALMAAVALPGQSAFALGTTTNLGTVGSPYSNGIGDNLLGDFDESFLDVYRFTLSPASPPSLFNAINITVDLEC